MTTSEAQPASPSSVADKRNEERPEQPTHEGSASVSVSTQTPASASEGASAGSPAPLLPQDAHAGGTATAPEVPVEKPALADGALLAVSEASPGTDDTSGEDAKLGEGASGLGDSVAATAPEAGEGSDASAPAATTKSKRRRGNKRDSDKSSHGKGSAGRGEAAHGGKEGSRGAFAALFASGPRRQVMAVGEFVAGLVDAVADGTFRLDLFGRGIAYVDINEPDLKELSDAQIAELRTESLTLDAAIAPAEGAGATLTVAQPSAPITGPITAPTTASGDSAEAPAAHADAPEAEASKAQHTAAGDTAELSEGSESTEVPKEAAAAAPGAGANAEDASTESEAEPSFEVGGEGGRATTTLATIEARARREAPQSDAIFRGRVVALAESGHLALVNRPVDVRRASQVLEHAAAARERVWGLVFGYNRGGFDVLIEGIRVFCPASSIDVHTPTEPKAWLGRKLQFHLSTKKSKGSDYVVTRRTIAERESRKRAGERLKHLKVGQKLKGAVVSVLDYALIVDLDGLEGFLHVSELSFDREAQPATLASVGDVLDVEVLRIEGGGRKDQRTKVSLTRKPFLDDPWDAHDEVLTPGRPTEGIVRRVAPFGAFVELSPGIEGLLHESEYAKGPDRLPKSPEVGSTVTVVVDKVDKRSHRIGLSMLTDLEAKAFEAAGRTFDAALLRSLKPGAELVAQIEKVDPRGVHLRIKGVFGRRGRGFMQSRELGEAERGALKKAPEGSQELKVKLVGMERDGTLKLSRRALVQDEERRAVQEYRKEASKQGFGTFADLLKAKLGE